MSRATAPGALKENDNREKTPLADLDGTSETDPKQCADKHLGMKFRKRGNPLYLAICARIPCSYCLTSEYAMIHDRLR